ncbi:MAG: hypothetical protein NVSMB9_34830 [Isosphaeraceae bacterium]
MRETARVPRRRNLIVALAVCLAVLGTLWLVTQYATRNHGGENRFVSQVAYAPDGKRLAWISEGAAGGSLVVWDVDRGRNWRVLRGRDCDPEPGVVSLFTSLAFSADGRTIATGTRSSPTPNHRVVFWDVETGRMRSSLRGHSDAIMAVAFSPDGKTLASASRDRSVKLWDVATGRLRARLGVGNVPVAALAFSPEGTTLATGWGDGVVRLWQVDSGEALAALKGHEQGVTCLAYSPDGKILASAGLDRTLRLRDGATGRDRSIHRGFSHAFRSIAFSPDGKTLAFKFAETSVGVLWDVGAGEERDRFSNAAAGLAFSPDGSTLAAAGGERGRVFLVPLTSSGSVNMSPR